MGRSENPLHPAFWLGTSDPRPLALFRIGLGLLLLQDSLCSYLPNLFAFLSDGGIVPRADITDPALWSVFRLVGSDAGVAAVFALGLVVLLAFTAGFHTRIATVLTFVFITSLHARARIVTDGGDDLVRYLLLYSCFTDLGGAYSLDARTRGRRAVPALGLRFMQLQIALLYFVAARLKFRLGWLSKNAIYTSLQLEGFLRPPGALLLHFPALCKLMTKLVLALEWVFAFLAFSPVRIAVCRALAIAAAVAVQGGILTTLRVGVFTGVCLWMNTLFLQPEWLDRAEAWWGARRGSPWPFSAEPRAVPVERGHLSGTPALRLLAFAFLATLFVGEAWGPFIGSKVREPQALVTERRFLQVGQAYDLFGSTYDMLRWKAPGERADGTAVDALTLTAPRTQDPVGWFFSPWTKFTFNVGSEASTRVPALGPWMCRVAAERGTPLARFRLIAVYTPPRQSLDEPLPPSREVVQFEQTCPRP